MTPAREPRSLAEIVREQTNDGLLIRFPHPGLQGRQDFDDTHRLEAAHRLLDFFIGFAILRQSPPDSTLAIVLSNDLGLFREVVRFETDAIEGRFDVAVRGSFSPRQKMHDPRNTAAEFSRVLRSETHRGSRNRFLSKRLRQSRRNTGRRQCPEAPR